MTVPNLHRHNTNKSFQTQFRQKTIERERKTDGAIERENNCSEQNRGLWAKQRQAPGNMSVSQRALRGLRRETLYMNERTNEQTNAGGVFVWAPWQQDKPREHIISTSSLIMLWLQVSHHGKNNNEIKTVFSLCRSASSTHQLNTFEPVRKKRGKKNRPWEGLTGWRSNGFTWLQECSREEKGCVWHTSN